MEPSSPNTSQLSVLSGKREQTKVQNRQLILDAARQVFAELGYGAATVRDIIRATPLASGTFYNYFKSKEEVYQALRDGVALALRPPLHDARSKATTAEAFIQASFRVYFDFIVKERASYRLFWVAADNTRHRLDTPEVLASFDLLREEIEDAIAKGLFPPIDAKFLMAAIVGASIEIGSHMLAQEPPDTAAATDFACALFLGGIKALPQIPPQISPAPAPETPASGQGV
jgi:AcrR family transcriptional regulator